MTLGGVYTEIELGGSAIRDGSSKAPFVIMTLALVGDVFTPTPCTPSINASPRTPPAPTWGEAGDAASLRRSTNSVLDCELGDEVGAKTPIST